MGKGRNNRHAKRRREQSRNSKREQKKDKKAKAAQQKRANKRKNKRKNKMSGWNEDAVQYIKLALSGRFLIEPQYSDYINKLRDWHKDGIVTDLTFFAFGKWNSRTRIRLKEILKENNNEWAWNHLVFKLPNEFETAFILRTIRAFKITHYIDNDKEHLKPLIMSSHCSDLKMFYWHDDAEHGWTEMKAWLKRHNPAYFSLYEQGEQAGFIIETGPMARPAPEETHVSDAYYEDFEDNEAWLGMS